MRGFLTKSLILECTYTNRWPLVSIDESSLFFLYMAVSLNQIEYRIWPMWVDQFYPVPRRHLLLKCVLYILVYVGQCGLKFKTFANDDY